MSKLQVCLRFIVLREMFSFKSQHALCNGTMQFYNSASCAQREKWFVLSVVIVSAAIILLNEKHLVVYQQAQSISDWT